MSAVRDLKIKSAAGKPPLAIVPKRAFMGAARVFEYGAKKYAPGNFYVAQLEDGAIERYMSAAERHAEGMQNPDGTWSRESAAARDEESGLPHLDHMICGLLMLRSILVKEGALEADPGEGNPPARVGFRAETREGYAGPAPSKTAELKDTRPLRPVMPAACFGDHKP